MDKDKLKRATASGLLFRFGERFLAQLITTVVTVVLARILLPEDYGIISIVAVLITLLNVFVSHGLGNALVQKKEYSQEDYSTMFWAGLVISVFLYFGIFVSSPLIASFYGNPLISDILRVMALRLPLAAVNSVQHAYVSHKLMFKKFFCVTLISTVVSGIVGIAMAYIGYGVWALVGQYISNVTLSTVLLLCFITWRPTLSFSFGRFKALFAFGWKVMAAEFINTLYEEIRSLIIGKKYGPGDLSFYTKGQQFPQLIGNNVSTTLTGVMFPVFSKLQDDIESLKAAVRRSIRMSLFALLPMMIGFFIVAENFVSVILTDKWLECVPYIRIFCVVYMFKPIKNINKSTLKALGRAEINLYVEIAEKILGVALILLTMNLGVKYLAFSVLVTYILGAITDAFINGRFLRYGVLEQLKDVLPEFCASVLMGTVVYFVGCLPVQSALLALVMQVAVGIVFYVALCSILRLESFVYLWKTVKKYFFRRKRTVEE